MCIYIGLRGLCGQLCARAPQNIEPGPERMLQFEPAVKCLGGEEDHMVQLIYYVLYMAPTTRTQADSTEA
jgi:hypothetical protein